MRGGEKKKISNLQKLHGVSVEGCRANQSLGWVTAEGGRCVQEAGGREGGRGGGEGVMHCSRVMEEQDEEEEEGEVWSRCHGNSVFYVMFSSLPEPPTCWQTGHGSQGKKKKRSILSKTIRCFLF